MTWTYDAGTDVPDVHGLCEFPALRINDGTFRPLSLPPIFSTAPLRVIANPLPSDDGGTFGPTRLDVWPFDIVCWFFESDDATFRTDLGSIIDYVRANVSVDDQTVLFNAPGWAEARQMTLRLGGQITIVEPEKGEASVPARDVTIPMLAVDPLLYSTTEHTVTIASATSVTNAGNFSTPFTVRFNGPVTDVRIDGPGTAGTNRLRYPGTIASGDWIEVSTNPAAAGGVTAVDQDGTNVYADLGAFTARSLPAGTSSWTKTVTSGAGAVTVTYRDAWS